MINIAVDGKGNLQVHRPHKFPKIAAATLQRPNVRAEKPTGERCRFPESRVLAPTRTFPPRPTSASSGRPTAPGEIPVPRAAPEPFPSFPHALARPEAPVLVAQEVRSTSAMLACVKSWGRSAPVPAADQDPRNAKMASEARCAAARAPTVQSELVQFSDLAPSLEHSSSDADRIRLAHRKKRVRSKGDFESDKARDAHALEREIDALIPLLPGPIVESMMGGADGMRQVPDKSAREEQIRATLRLRAGSEGKTLAHVRGMLRDVRTYALEVRGLRGASADR